jgi:hypothetical protein
MRKITILFSALLVLAIPSAAQAHHSGPSKADHAAAVKACRAERGTTDASKAAFAAKYGTNHNKRNAFGKCVSKGGVLPESVVAPGQPVEPPLPVSAFGGSASTGDTKHPDKQKKK